MRSVRLHSARRGGFTLVELLVAAAVSIVLMLIITEAFKRGIDMFRTMRAQGQMQDRLRLAAQTMRDDLASYHFSSNDNSDRYYLSGQDLRTDEPPDYGFFRIYQAVDPANDVAVNPALDPCIYEGTDREGIVFSRSRTHAMHFTVYRRETSPTVKFPVDPSYLFRVIEPDRVLSAGPPPTMFPRDFIDPPDFRETGRFASRWAEVAYFLVPNGNSANGTPLYNLIRRVKLLLPEPAGYANVPPGNIPAAGGGGVENPEISARSQYLLSGGVVRYYNRSSDVTQPRNRLGMAPATNQVADQNNAGLLATGNYPQLANELVPLGFSDPRAGDDVLMTDVLSFEIKATWDPGPFMPAPRLTLNLPAFGSATYPNTDYPFDFIPLSPNVPGYKGNMVLAARGLRVFDTWSKASQDNEVLTPNPVIYGQPSPNPGYLMWNDPTDTTPDNETGARIPLRIRVKALQIKLRVYDTKVEQARQLTFIQDM